MADYSVTVTYEITSITNNGDFPETATVAYTLDHEGNDIDMPVENRSDSFLVSELTRGIDTFNATTEEKQTALKSNFETLANFHFTTYANKVRRAHARVDDELLDDLTGSVDIASIMKAFFGPILKGSVVVP